jgi:glucose-1-phosphate thymidylyltransferase
LGRGYAWFDAGTFAALLEAAEFVHVQQRHGQLVFAPEEISFKAGWISASDLAREIEGLGNTDYGRKLAALNRVP